MIRAICQMCRNNFQTNDRYECICDTCHNGMETGDAFDALPQDMVSDWENDAMFALDSHLESAFEDSVNGGN